MKRSITITAWNRPECLNKTLGTLLAVKPMFRYKVFVQVDGFGDPAVLDVCKRWGIKPSVSNRRLGIDWNNFSLFDKVLRWGTNFNIALEDDILVSPDFFDLSRFYECQAHDKYLAYCFFSDENRHDLFNRAFPKRRFCPWGWAWSRSQFIDISNGWGTQFDTRLDSIASERPCLTPCLSRTSNIGYDGAGTTNSHVSRKFLTGIQPSLYHGTDFILDTKYVSSEHSSEFTI